MKLNALALRDCISYEDEIKELQRKIKTKKIGNLGRAIMKASKENKKEQWLKKQLDTFFKKLRRNNA